MSTAETLASQFEGNPFDDEDAAEEEPTAYTKAEQAHYQAIKEKELQVGKLASAATAAKERAKAAKSRHDEAATELHELIRRGPDDQQKLPGMEDADKPASDAWRDMPLSAAGIDGGLAKALAAEEMETLGQVADYLSSGNNITDVKGIGPEKGERYEELMVAFWEEHPEFCEGGEDDGADDEPDEGETDDDEEDEDEEDDSDEA